MEMEARGAGLPWRTISLSVKRQGTLLVPWSGGEMVGVFAKSPGGRTAPRRSKHFLVSFASSSRYWKYSSHVARYFFQIASEDLGWSLFSDMFVVLLINTSSFLISECRPTAVYFLIFFLMLASLLIASTFEWEMLVSLDDVESYHHCLHCLPSSSLVSHQQRKKRERTFLKLIYLT
jgi:hypothetical protein